MIRAAQADDSHAVAAIWNHVIRDTAATFNAVEKTPQEIEALIAARHRAGHAFLVAEHDGTVAGFATYDQFRGGIGYRHSMEHSVHVAASARGLGLGRALMAALEDHARAASVHVMVAGVSSENPDGRAFHEALGYRLTGTIEQVGCKFGRWMDLWLLQKILT